MAWWHAEIASLEDDKRNLEAECRKLEKYVANVKAVVNGEKKVPPELQQYVDRVKGR